MEPVIYYSLAEAAEILSVSKQSVYRYIYGGALKATKVNGKMWRIASTDLAEFMAPTNLDYIKLQKKETQKNGKE